MEKMKGLKVDNLFKKICILLLILACSYTSAFSDERKITIDILHEEENESVLNNINEVGEQVDKVGKTLLKPVEIVATNATKVLKEKAEWSDEQIKEKQNDLPDGPKIKFSF